MNKKFYFFCIFLLVFSVVFHGFSALETGSGSGSNSGSMNAPLVKYKEWQVGRSDTGTDKNKAEHLSFITSTGTSCQFSASVGYQGGSQPQNTSPIDPDTVKWDVIDANHSMTFDKSSMSKNWSGKHPSKFDTSTSFNVVAKVTVPSIRRTLHVRRTMRIVPTERRYTGEIRNWRSKSSLRQIRKMVKRLKSCCR